MKVLVVGSGGREHALCWKIAQSPQVDQVYCAPGNAGTAMVAQNLDLSTAEIKDWALQKDIDLVVVGPEAPLVAGLSDELRAAGLACFGCSAQAAALEGSKSFAKAIMQEAGVPTASYATFDDAETAKAYIRQEGAPLVIKADGLAAGKGVVVAMTQEEALTAVDDLQGYGSKLVIEEFLQGPELSFFALCDGKRALALQTAQDHKRVGEGDKGPNTGGMGAFSPTPFSSDALHQSLIEKVVQPTLDAMAARGTPFQGLLFVGLMMTEQGPKVIEFNVRFGDPECQVLMMRLASDLMPALLATAKGDLSEQSLTWHEDTALTVVMAAKGYPGSYEKGTDIRSLPSDQNDLQVFHAGTSDVDGPLKAVGGRVLNVTAKAPSAQEARDRAYDGLRDVNWPDGFYRRDIAWQALAKEQA